MKIQKVTNGAYWVEIPEADLRILCGCPADIVKHLKKSGFLFEKEKSGSTYETGPNAILLSDAAIQNGSFANLAEFPILQMFYKQGMLLPNHPNNNGNRPILIGLKDQVLAQTQYIYRGNYGLISVDEIMETGFSEQQAKEMMAMKLRFAFDDIKNTEDLIDFKIIEKDGIDIKDGVILRRQGFNQYEFSYNGESTSIDLNLSYREKYLSPFLLKPRKISREYFSIIHTGEGNGWDVNRPCMASMIMFQGKIYLIDAGPGITHTLRALGLCINEIEGIFHTHAHDDHFAGLTDLVRSDHMIKYYATPLVRSTVVKKLSALMTFEERDFEKYFDVYDLEFDEWNNIDGLEVKPVLSPHPVETSVLFFRTLGQSGFKTYAHLADIPAFDVLDKMVSKNPATSGISDQYCQEVKKMLLTQVDLKKIDIGGGIIHGMAKDFLNDKSSDIHLSHIDRELTSEEKKVGHSTIFGAEDVLIRTQQDYSQKSALDYLKLYFPSVPPHDINMLMNCPVVFFNPGTPILPKTKINKFIYLILDGLVEFVHEDSGIINTFSSTALLGEMSGLLKQKSQRNYQAVSTTICLKIPADLYSEFIIRNGLYENVIKVLENRIFLQSTWLFGDMLSFPIQYKIAQAATKRELTKGELCEKNKTSKLYLVDDGVVEIYYREKLIETLERGSFLGEEGILQGNSELFDIRIIEKAEILEIPGNLLSKIPIVLWKLLETFERRKKVANIFL